MSKIMTAFEIFLAHEFVTWDKFDKVFSATNNELEFIFSPSLAKDEQTI